MPCWPGNAEQPLLNRINGKLWMTLRIALDGVPQGAEVQPDAFTLSLRAADGSSQNLGIAACSQLRRETISPDRPTIVAVCLADSPFFRVERGKRVAVRGSLYLTLYGSQRSQTIPLTNQPSNALDGLQCYTGVVGAEWDVYCRSAFRWPARLIYAKLGHTNANSFTQNVSYSPFPASLDIEPVETRWASGFAASMAPIVRDVTIITEEPLAHFHRDFTGDLQLYDYDPWLPRYLPPPAIQ